MLLNNTISILSNARLRLGDMAFDLTKNIQQGLNNTEEQKEIYRRIVLTYAIIKALDPIIPINDDDEIEYILGDHDNVKLNRLLLYLRDISGSQNKPVLSKILNPIVQELGDGGPQGQTGASGTNAYLYVGYADNASGAGYSTSPTGHTFIALKQSNVALTSVTAATFAGLWIQFVGNPGSPGSPDFRSLDLIIFF